jgi:hypothetical protein
MCCDFNEKFRFQQMRFFASQAVDNFGENPVLCTKKMHAFFAGVFRVTRGRINIEINHWVVRACVCCSAMDFV